MNVYFGPEAGEKRMSRFASAAARTKCPNAVSKASRSLLRRGDQGPLGGGHNGHRNGGGPPSARRKPALHFAHVTNHMALSKGDSTKGEADGTEASLSLVAAMARAWDGEGR